MFGFVKTLLKYVVYYLIVTIFGVGLSYLLFGRNGNEKVKHLENVKEAVDAEFC